MLIMWLVCFGLIVPGRDRVLDLPDELDPDLGHIVSW